MTYDTADQVPRDNPGAREIRFAVPESYNASRILFDNIAHGRGERLALTGPGGTRTYAQLCAEASQWGHGFQSLGLKPGDRIQSLQQLFHRSAGIDFGRRREGSGLDQSVMEQLRSRAAEEFSPAF